MEYQNILNIGIDMIKQKCRPNLEEQPAQSLHIYIQPTMLANLQGDGRGQGMVLGNLQCRNILLIWIIQKGPIVLAVGADGGI